jgi:hypothetical protein
MAKRAIRRGFTAGFSALYTFLVNPLRPAIARMVLSCLFGATSWVLAQETAAPKPAEKSANQEPAEKEKRGKSFETQGKPELPFQIQLLATHIGFEANGDSRKEVHTIVKIINILGAHQFARLAFDYNRSFQQVEIPMVHISHANGGTSDVLPSAVTDNVNPAIEAFPAYHDVRVKAVRILGLQAGDTIEYRVITTTTKHPLAPDFWLEHTFDRSGQILEEHYEVDLPASRTVQIFVAASTPAKKEEESGPTESARTRYVWNRSAAMNKTGEAEAEPAEPDIVLTSYSSWEQFANRIAEQLIPNREQSDALLEKGKEIAKGERSGKWIEPLYDFVSQKIRTVDLPLGATGFHTRTATEILSSGYGTAEDKFFLFAALAENCCGVKAGLIHSSPTIPVGGLPRPTVFDHLLTISGIPSTIFWMDLNLEVAPLGMIPSQFRGKTVLLVGPERNEVWRQVPQDLPVRGVQNVTVEASIAHGGELSAKVKYVMRGDNELTLRMAFHQAPKDRWKDVANLLAISDGFRGQIANVNASDPMDTKDPFTVEYELAQPKFVDWSKKPVRIPALLPQIGLPDTTPTTGVENLPQIELGTPLEVQTTMTLKLPPGTTVETPPGTSVSRDYATFTSKYSATQNTVTASRHINFLKRELPVDRATDYNAFVHAVQNDQAARLTLVQQENGK